MSNSMSLKAYLQGLVYISCVDGTLADEEKVFFINKGKELGLAEDEITTSINEVVEGDLFIEEILNGLAGSEYAVSFVRDLVELCYTDGEYSIEEQLGVRHVANYLDIELDTIKGIEIVYAEMAARAAEAAANEEQNKSGLRKALDFGKNMAKVTGKAIVKGGKLLFKKAVEGRDAAARSVSNGIGLVGSKLSIAVANAKKLREENKTLREELGKTTLTEAVKQKVVMKLNSKVVLLNDQLSLEKERNQKNEEMIELLQAQLDDVLATLEMAETAKTA